MRSKVADLLNFIQDKPLKHFEWHIAFLFHLNQKVDDSLKINEDNTGQETLAIIVQRGTQTATPLLLSTFDTSTGEFFSMEQEKLVEETKRKIEGYTWSKHRQLILIFGLLITGLVIWATYRGSQFLSAEQAGVVETAIKALSDIAQTSVHDKSDDRQESENRD